MIQNLRDLGGLKTIDGRTVRSNCLIRSAHLFRATEDDLENVSAVIDLRTPGERTQAPDQTYHCQYHPLPIFDDEQAGISHEQDLSAQLLPDMANLYRRLVNECTDTFRTVLTTIMDHDFSSGAILWHCTEGKDRCGMTTAMILEMLGVDREVIMQDYLKTNDVNLSKAILMSQKAAAQGKEFAEGVYQAYIADERYLQAAWDAMGIDYIRQRLGIANSDIARFRDAVLV